MLQAAEDTVIFAGVTSSEDFPTTPRAYDQSYNGSGSAYDVFAVRLAFVGPAALEAQFIGEPTYSQVPMLVQFTNYSSGNYTSCLWEFDDGATSSDCGNPSHLYSTAGTYSVRLTVSDGWQTDAIYKWGYIHAYN